MESGTITPVAGKAVDAPTLNEALRRTAATHPEIVAVRSMDDSTSLTWAELLERVDALAGGLDKLGVKRGQTVAIMLSNRPEFHITDLAAVTLGATPFSIYTTYPAGEIEYLVNDAGARLAIVEQAFLPVVLEARRSLPQLEHVIVVDGEAPQDTLALAGVEGSDPGFDPSSVEAPQPDDVLMLSYLPQIHPTWFFAVPRIWEKLKAGLEAMLAGQPEEQRKPVEEAMAASLERVRLRQAGQPVPDGLEAQVAEADQKFVSGIRTMLGLDQVSGVNVGAAPTPVEVLEFFHALGIELAELWGMSETCGAGTCNRPGQVKIGTVGPPAPGCEIKIADDGEVLVRSEFVMMGYRNQPDQTAEAIDADGWLHTGDIGELDEDGYLRLVDRKNEIIINAAGKNMSTANTEAAIKTASPLIGQAITIGDRRPYNTALIVLDADFAPQWAKQQGLDGSTLEELARQPTVVAAVQAGIDTANQRL